MSLAKDEKAKIVKKFGKSAKDTGSTATQVALLTKRIEELQSHFKKHNKDKKRVREAIKRIKEVGGLEFAQEKMGFFHVRAIELLKTFPKNTYRDSLELMVNYVIERNI